MPWSEKSIMSQRHEFVMLFEQEGVNRRELCRRFGISPTVGSLAELFHGTRPRILRIDTAATFNAAARESTGVQGRLL